MGLFDITGIGPIADLAKEILSMFPNAEQRAQAANKLQDLVGQVATQQNATNEVEAGSSSIFVAGWRPACGWICVAGLFYSSILQPALHLPAADTNTLIAILTSMLGLGAMRTTEKALGVPETKFGKK